MSRTLRTLALLAVGAALGLLAERALRALGPTEAYDRPLPESDEEDLFPASAQSDELPTPWSDESPWSKGAANRPARARRRAADPERLRAAALAAGLERKARLATKRRATPRTER